MADVFAVAQILVDHALAAHPGEIALIAYYGSHAKGTATATSDLDLFYIPDSGRAASLCTQFVLDDLPYDFWPVSWGFAADIAHARGERPWAYAASLIADARVLYHRSPADLERFQELQELIARSTRPESRPLMIGRAVAAFPRVLFQLQQVRLAHKAGDWRGLHAAARRCLDHALNCLALANQVYFSKGAGASIPEALALPLLPEALEATIRALLRPGSEDEVVRAAGQLAADVRALLRDLQQDIATPAPVTELFQDYYSAVHEYAHKVTAACARGDAYTASYDAFILQTEISALLHQSRIGYNPAEFNLLGEYAAAYEEAGFPDLLAPAVAGDLPALAARTRLLQAKFRTWLEEQGVATNIVPDLAGLRLLLQQRDPLP